MPKPTAQRLSSKSDIKIRIRATQVLVATYPVSSGWTKEKAMEDACEETGLAEEALEAEVFTTEVWQ